MQGRPGSTQSVAPLGPAGLERYQLALEAGRMGTWYWDVAHGTLDWDEQLHKVFGLDPATFEGTFEAYLALLHPDDVAHTVATIQQSMEGGRDHYVEHRVLLRDGSLRWVNGTGRAVLGPDGEVIAMMGVGADITEQRAATEARIAAEEASAVARDAAERSQARLALLGRVSRVLGASLDVSTTLQQLADLVVEEHLADWCVVEIPGGPHGIAQLALAHRDPAMIEMARRWQVDYPPELTDDSGLGKVLRTGEPELWPTIPAEVLVESARDEAHLEIIRSLSLSAGMIIPLPARGRVLGALSMLGTDGRSFDEHDLAAAVELGRRAGVALDNANIYADRDRVARTLQESLLPPRLPVVPGLDLAAHYRPGSRSLGIGGDFYDVFPAGDGSWRVVIGDVCGKGVEAAALTGAVRYALRTAAVLATSPAEALRVVNETFLHEDWDGRFATLALLQVEPIAGGARVTLASGGHPPALLRRAAGEVERVEVPGSLIGLLPEAEFGETTRDLEAGDCLLLYTDGATEAGSHGDLFGEDRLIHVVETAPAHSAADLVGAVADAVDAFTGGPHESAGPADDGSRDDLAVMCVRVG
ncbi:MAG: SpoIIE family protein phosphatase [Actinomycetes bacterium]